MYRLNYYREFTLSLTAFIWMLLPSTLQSQNALNFDGANDYVQTTYGGVTGSANRTFEAWVNVDAGLSTNSAILDYGSNAAGSRNTFAIGSSYQLSFLSGGTNANMSSPSNAITPGQWTHVAFVLNSGTGYLYVNGTQVATGTLTSVNTPSGNTNLRIGERVPGGTIPFLGEIDEVRVWDYARTTQEINDDIDDEFCSSQTGLVAYYKLNEGVAGGSNSGITTAFDASGAGNNGTLSGFSLSGATSNWVTGVALGTAISTATVAITGCDSLTSPSGNYTWYNPGTYFDTIQNTAGCDSAITINLSIAASTNSNISVSECYEYTSPSGNHTWSTSGTYQDTIANAAGCDSILNIQLSIGVSFDTFSVASCGAYTSPSGNHVWHISGSHFDTLTNSVGCDSVLFILLQINSDKTSNLTETACVSYTSPSGIYQWTTSGNYTDTLIASNGCDSIISIALTVLDVNTGVNVFEGTLNANASGATYQWINCSDNQPINGETEQSYKPTQTGNYAVVVTQNGCSDTSDCMNVTVVGIEQRISDWEVTLYPNPTSGSFTIDLGDGEELVSVRVINSEGKVVKTMDGAFASKIQLDLEQAAGLYTVYVYAEDQYRAFRVMKVD